MSYDEERARLVERAKADPGRYVLKLLIELATRDTDYHGLSHLEPIAPMVHLLTIRRMSSRPNSRSRERGPHGSDEGAHVDTLTHFWLRDYVRFLRAINEMVIEAHESGQLVVRHGEIGSKVRSLSAGGEDWLNRWFDAEASLDPDEIAELLISNFDWDTGVMAGTEIAFSPSYACKKGEFQQWAENEGIAGPGELTALLQEHATRRDKLIALHKRLIFPNSLPGRELFDALGPLLFFDRVERVDDEERPQRANTEGRAGSSRVWTEEKAREAFEYSESLYLQGERAFKKKAAERYGVSPQRLSGVFKKHGLSIEKV